MLMKRMILFLILFVFWPGHALYDYTAAAVSIGGDVVQTKIFWDVY
jgi:hypothetical protein